MSELRTVEYEPSRLDDVLRVFERTYGEAPSRAEFEWWFDGNPVGRRNVFLALDAERVAGMVGVSLYRAMVDGRESLVGLPVWVVTDPDYRGRGIFQQLNVAGAEAVREQGAVLELGFTNRAAGPLYLSKLGWSDVDWLRIWARPLVPVVGGRGACVRTHNFVVQQENAYEELAPGLPNHFVRDAAYLNWRYVDAPRPYTIVPSRNGYAVVGRKRFKGVDCAFVADLVAPTFRETRWLLRRCVRAARGARVLLALLPSVHAGAYLSAGFVPTPTKIHLIGLSLGDSPLPTGSGSWHFTLGDTDYF